VSHQGDTAAARTLIEESLALRRELGDKHGIAWSLIVRGVVARDEGDLAAAHAYLADALALAREIGFRQGIANCLLLLAGLARMGSKPARATRLLGAAAAVREAIAFALPPADRAEHDADAAALRDALGEDAFEAAWSAGRAMSLDEAIADAVLVSEGPPDPAAVARTTPAPPCPAASPRARRRCCAWSPPATPTARSPSSSS